MKKPQIEVNIFSYDDEVLNKMVENDIKGIPSCFYFLDVRKTNTWCHDYSDLLAYLIEGANRVQGWVYGNQGLIEHSWVEYNGLCYDVTTPVVWNKGFYYEFHGVRDAQIIPREKSIEFAEPYFAPATPPKELVVATIRDIEQNIEETMHPSLLAALIEMYKEQEYPDENECDEKLIEKYMKRINNFYKKTERFKKKTEIKQKLRNGLGLDER